jgi:hypothetical protein
LIFISSNSDLLSFFLYISSHTTWVVSHCEFVDSIKYTMSLSGRQYFPRWLHGMISYVYVSWCLSSFFLVIIDNSFSSFGYSFNFVGRQWCQMKLERPSNLLSIPLEWTVVSAKSWKAILWSGDI